MSLGPCTLPPTFIGLGGAVGVGAAAGVERAVVMVTDSEMRPSMRSERTWVLLPGLTVTALEKAVNPGTLIPTV